MNKHLLLFILVIFTYSSPSLSRSWFDDRLESIEKENKCRIIYGDRKNIGHFTITPNYFIGWCLSETSNLYNLIALSSGKSDDWNSCGKIIKVKESSAENNMRVKKGVDPYGELFPMYKFWTLDSLDNEFYDYLESEELASGMSLYYGDFGNIEQIVYCYKGQWVMSGYH